MSLWQFGSPLPSPLFPIAANSRKRSVPSPSSRSEYHIMQNACVISLPLLQLSSPNLPYVPPPRSRALSPSPAPSIYKRSRSEFLKRHFHVPCVLPSHSPPPPPPPHFPILRTSGELSDDKSSKSSILPLKSSSSSASSSSLSSPSLSFALLLPL